MPKQVGGTAPHTIRSEKINHQTDKSPRWNPKDKFAKLMLKLKFASTNPDDEEMTEPIIDDD